MHWVGSLWVYRWTQYRKIKFGVRYVSSSPNHGKLNVFTRKTAISARVTGDSGQ